jgi:hypothetical protein
MRQCPQLFESGIGIFGVLFLVPHSKAKIGLPKPKNRFLLVNVCESETISLQRYFITVIPIISVVFPCMLIITQLLFQQNALVFIKSTRYYSLYFLSLYS